jgi:hypothetical protein
MSSLRPALRQHQAYSLFLVKARAHMIDGRWRFEKNTAFVDYSLVKEWGKKEHIQILSEDTFSLTNFFMGDHVVPFLH